MEAIFDVAMLEVFADRGTFACAQVVYPTTPYNRISIEGEAKLLITTLNYDSEGIEEA